MGVAFTICKGCGAYVGSDITDHACGLLAHSLAVEEVVNAARELVSQVRFSTSAPFHRLDAAVTALDNLPPF